MSTTAPKSEFTKKRSQRMAVEWTPYPAFPREVFFDISNACNHSCIFCSNQKITDKANLDKDLAFRLIKECAENGTKDIGFYATGEPFIRNDLADFIRYAKENGIEYVFITTNGALATPERALPALEAGLDSVKFSINAGTRESYIKVHGKDDFDKVIEHVKWFDHYRKTHNKKLGLYFSMVPTHFTKDDWPILQSILGPYTDDKDLRGCSNQGGNMFENNYTEEVDKENLLGSLSREQFCGRCPDPFFRATITPQGFLTTCVVDYQNYLCVADLHETTLKEAWHNELFAGLRQRHLDGKIEGLICHNCLGNCNEFAAPLVEKYARPFKHQSWDKLEKTQ